MVYIDMNGDVVCDYLDPKKLLDDFGLSFLSFFGGRP